MPLLLLALLTASFQVQPADTVLAVAPPVDAPVAGAVTAAEWTLGVVWAPPDSTADAVRELTAMRRAGVRAVRLPAVERPALLEAADRLGIALFQDLPLRNVPAGRLPDTLAFAERVLRRVLEASAGHPSAQAFGLCTYCDTSEPAARAFFERLTAVVREAGPPGAKAYYLSRFVDADRADTAVDFVLLDARDHADPSEVLARWREPSAGFRGHTTPVGLGAYGFPVQAGVEGGWRTPGSPAAQARSLERALGALEGADPAPVAAFVHRWRDVAGASGYGLVGADGAPRPARDVLEGFYTGRQRIFAIDAGPRPHLVPGAPTFVTLAWGIVLALVGLAVGAPRFPLLAERYFSRHGYYREAVQRGSALEGWASFAALVTLSLAAGVAAAAALHLLGRTDVLDMLMGPMTEAARVQLAEVVARPWLAALLLGGLYLAYVLLNAVWLFLVAGRRRRVRPGQALVLATWSRWTVLLVMAGALALVLQGPAGAARWVPALLIGWVVVEAAAGVRMLYDFSRVAGVPGPRVWGLGFLVPIVVAAVGLGFVLALVGPEAAFLWNLATKQ